MLALLGPLATLVGTEVQTLIARYKREVIVWAVVGCLLTVGTVFLLIAANNGLTLAYGPVVAPLIMAGAALFAGLVVYLVARFRAAAEERAAADRRHSAETTALVTSAAISAVPLLAKSGLLKKVGLPLGGALAAAYLLTRPHHDGEP